MFKKVFTGIRDKLKGLGKAYMNEAHPKEDPKSKEEAQEKLTFSEARRKHTGKRRRNHSAYAKVKRKRTAGADMQRKFRVKSMRRFLPKIKIKDSKRKWSPSAFIVNSEHRDTKAEGLTFNPTGAAAKKKHQRGIWKGIRNIWFGNSGDAFIWADGGEKCRQSLDYHLSRGGK